MQIEGSNEQFSQQKLSIRVSLDLGANVSEQRPPQFLKQDSPMISTEDGMQIEESDEQPRKAESSIRER
jgi:hypothetical protein